MTEAQLDLLAQARESLSAAKLLLANGYPGYAAARAYYSMFYAAEAFLEGDGLAFSSHKAVIAAFGKEFARTGPFHLSCIDTWLTPRSCGIRRITGLTARSMRTGLLSRSKERSGFSLSRSS